MGEPIEITQPGIDLADDVVGADEPLVQRGGEGSGFFEHVGREGELGGSAPEGSLSPVGREPLPSSRDAEREPPSLVKDVEVDEITGEDVSGYYQLMSDMAMHLPDDVEAQWLAQTRVFGLQEEEKSTEDAEGMTDFQKEKRSKESEKRLQQLVPMWDMMQFNMEQYDLADFASDERLKEIEAMGERIERLAGEPEPTRVYDLVEERGDADNWSAYEPLLPDHILRNDYARENAMEAIRRLTVYTDASVSLDPYYTGEPTEAYVVGPMLMGEWDEFEKSIHPEVMKAVGEAWRQQAMTEGTPENASAFRNGGSDPKMWIETIAADMTGPQWMPTDYSGKEYAVADNLNAGWQQATASPGGQLAMESAERLFGESLGAEAPPRDRNEVIASDDDTLDEKFKTGYKQYEQMTAEDIHAFLDDESRQATSDVIVQRMYDDTQKWYADRGFAPNDLVPLYRGMGHIDSAWNPSGVRSDEVGDSDVDMFSLSSWTAQADETAGFGGGALVKGFVPVENILANPQTGFPCRSEREIVVIGGTDFNATIYGEATHFEAAVHDLNPDYRDEGVKTTWDVRQVIKDNLGTGYETPEYSEIVERSRNVISVDLEDADWITERLAAVGLTRDMIDGLSNIGPDGEEVEEDEIERRRKKYYGKKRAQFVRGEREIDNDSRLPVEMTPEGGAIFQIPVEEPAEAVEEEIVERGGPGSGFKGHVGREGEQGGSAPEGSTAPVSNRPGVESYGSAVFTPVMHDIVIGWSDQPGYQVAALIENNVRQAQERGDDDYHGLAIGQDGILMGIGALDYSAEFPEGYGDDMKPEDYLKIDGLYTVEAGFSEELMVQMAMEANRNGKGVWMEMGDEAGVLAAQMGMDVSEDGKYAHWTPEQTAEVAEKLQGLEQVDYVSPPTKPRITVAFDEVYEEEESSNPTPDDREPPIPVSEMSLDERYRWENFNYSRWATADRWDPQASAREQLGYEVAEEGEEEEFISNVYDARVLEDMQAVHDGWIEGTDTPWSVRFSEAVASRFGGESVPASRPREKYDSPEEFLDELSDTWGEETIISGRHETRDDFLSIPVEEQWAELTEFNEFAAGARTQDIATDLVAVVDAMYEKTQAEFEAAGYEPGDTVRLYRGLKANPEERLGGHDGGWTDVEQWSVSSWSAGKAVAASFATGSGGESAAGQGTLFTADVPVEKILANWQTGPGSHGELEYLVIGSEPIEAYASKITETANINRVSDAKKEEAKTEAGDFEEYAFGTEIE